MYLYISSTRSVLFFRFAVQIPQKGFTFPLCRRKKKHCGLGIYILKRTKNNNKRVKAKSNVLRETFFFFFSCLNRFLRLAKGKD